MEDAEFDLEANKLINDISDWLENTYSDLDIEFNENILYITNEIGVYVINKHNVLKQIWISSPKTGAYHFYFDILQHNWINTKNPDLSLSQLLEQELND